MKTPTAKHSTRNMKMSTLNQNIQIGTKRRQFHNKTINQKQKDANSKIKPINHEHREANSKTKQSTRNRETPTQTQNNQLGT